MRRGFGKQDRYALLTDKIHENPFLTDVELAELFGVSVQTIRLDRLALGVPELRERMKEVAARTYGQVKSLGSKEIVGELIDISLGQNGISILETTEDMVFEKTRIVRGHFIFAQADSLAIALIDADIVLTGLANIKFKRPVQVGEKLVAKAEVLRKKGKKFVVLVQTRVGQEPVFRGKFVVFAVEPKSAGDRPLERRGGAER
ncbi:MAG TPA: transcription factor FapR [Bacillota bacterium]|jgi:acyl-coenzyme A thioesterase PaaI-like protein